MADGTRSPRYPSVVPAPARPPSGPARGASASSEVLVQVFGLPSDRATRAAIRFFKERRIAISFVDLRKRPIAPAELRRFADRLGPRALLDETSRAYRDAGLAYMRLDDDEILERLRADVDLLRLPLVRRGHSVSAGPAEATWTGWLKPTDRESDASL